MWSWCLSSAFCSVAWHLCQAALNNTGLTHEYMYDIIPVSFTAVSLCFPESWLWMSLLRRVGQACVATLSWSLRSTCWTLRVCRGRNPTEVKTTAAVRELQLHVDDRVGNSGKTVTHQFHSLNTNKWRFLSWCHLGPQCHLLAVRSFFQQSDRCCLRYITFSRLFKSNVSSHFMDFPSLWNHTFKLWKK